jgi:hypothetical protein
VLLGCSLIFLLYREWRAGGGWRGALPLLGCFAVMAAGGALIAAVQLLPTLDIARGSQRIDRSFGFREYFDTLGRVPWRYFVTLLFPDFFGSPPLGFNAIPRLPRQEYMNYNELCLYLGVPALFALLAALCARGNRFSRFYLGLVALVAAWLAGTWLYYPLFALVPGMNRMNPTRLTFLFVFVAAVAAGLGFARLPHLRGRRRAAFLAAAGLLLAAAALLAVAGDRPWVHGVFDRESAQGPWAPQLLGGLRQLRGPGSPVMYRQLLLALAAAALAAGALLLRGRRRSACTWLFVLLAAGDLIRFGRAYNSYADPREVYPRTPAIEFLLTQPRPFRVVQDAGRGFYVNTLAPFGIEELGGYSSFYPDRTGALLAAAAFGPAVQEGRRFDRWVTFRGGSRLFDLLNVRYLLTAPGASRSSPGLRLVYRGEVEIYESATALPRAWVARRWVPAGGLAEALARLDSAGFDPRGEVVGEAPPDPAFAASVSPPPRPDRVAIERHAADEVVVAADVASPGWLVLADAWHPGWRARVDGGERPILRVDVNLRAVALPAGAHRVVFTFDPPAYRWGRRLTVLGLLLAAAGALGAWYARRRAAPRAPAPVANV